MDTDVSWGNGRECPLVVYSDLQSVDGFRCYDNIAPNAKCQRVFFIHSMTGFTFWPRDPENSLICVDNLSTEQVYKRQLPFRKL